MLDKHLVVNTSPKSRKENIVYWGNYRITILQDKLFRLERSERKQFRDEATQTVWFRDMPAQEFNTIVSDEKIVIKTATCSLVVKKERKNCYIQLNEKNITIDNTQNLKGTARTLDRCDGDMFKDKYQADIAKVELDNSVCSLKGVAVFDDAHSLTLDTDGEVKPIYGDGSDEYIFAYGDDYRAAVKALYLICGNTPLIPRFALGNWWSRYHMYTDKEYLRLLNSFEEQEIPLSVATLDMDWHYSTNMESDLHITEKGRNTPFHGGANGWTGYTWNKRLFPDYKALLKKIKEKDLKITLNLHPADGIRWWEDCYEDMANAMGVDAENGEQVKFDIANPNFINAYFSKIHKPYEKDGVSFWWIDWQQGTSSGMEGLDPLWSLNHYHYLDNASNHSTPLILSRYAGIGSHRYPLGFSGDTYITWKTLDYLPYFTATASNIGYTWWSHDIGGHMYGQKDNEMYLRHLQYGVFSPINRLHCCAADVCTKEPWAYGNGYGELAKKWLRFRHKLIPFLYTASYLTHKEGIALVEPLYYEWKNPKAYEYKNEYLFGGELLVAPVTSPAEKDGFARVKVWLPQGKWTNIFTNTEYDAPIGGKEFILYCSAEDIPVFIKEGGILPLSANKGNSVENPAQMDIWVWCGNSKYTLYEDGMTQNIDEQLFTTFQTSYEENSGIAKQTLQVSMQGSADIIPNNRVLKIRFKNIEDGKISLFIDNNQTEVPELLTDCTALDLPIEPDKTYRIEVVFEPKTALDKLKDHAKKTLICAQGIMMDKYALWNQLKQVESIESFVSLVDETDKISEIAKLCLKETCV